MSESESPFKSLAPWKHWWTEKDTAKVAEAVAKRLVVKDLPGKGEVVQLKEKGKVGEKDFGKECANNSAVAEGLLLSFPAGKQGSGYFFGDAMLQMNDTCFNGCILGPVDENPLKEDVRRKLALKEGAKWKLILSYVRQRASRTSGANLPVIVHLKKLTGRKSFGGKSNASRETFARQARFPFA